MARLLVRLKARLLLNTLSRGVQPAVGLLLAGLIGVVFALACFVMLAATGASELWSDMVVLVFAGIWVAWLVLPMLTFSSDETLDPRRFALLPVRPRALVPGLLLAAFVGVGPVATALGTAGAIPGAAVAGASPLGMVIAAVAVVLLILCCLASSRALTTVASNVLASRRGRDLAALAAGLLAILGYLAFQAVVQLSDADLELTLGGPAAVARFLPGGLAGAAVGWGAAGAYVPALLALVGVAAWTLLALGVWGRAMERVDRRQPARSGSAVRSGRADLYPSLLGWLPRTRLTAVAMRFLRGLSRDSRVRTQALQQVFVLLPVLMVSVTTGVLMTEYAPLLAALLVVPVGMIAVNQLGLDGPALWLHELAGARPVPDLLGRNLALALVAVPPVVIAAIALAIWSGGWVHVPAAFALAIATLAIVLAPANLGAVLLPVPVPEQTNNLFGSGQSGQGCVNGFLSIGVMVAQGILLLPVLVPLVLVEGSGTRTVVAVLGAVYGVVVLTVGTRLAAARQLERGPELLVAIDPGQG